MVGRRPVCVCFTWKSHCIPLCAGERSKTLLRAHISQASPALSPRLSQSHQSEKGKQSRDVRLDPGHSPPQPPSSGLCLPSLLHSLATVSPRVLTQYTLPKKCKKSLQVCDYRHFQEARASISYIENKLFLGDQNFISHFV